jgi:hypothetical protein
MVLFSIAQDTELSVNNAVIAIASFLINVLDYKCEK